MVLFGWQHISQTNNLQDCGWLLQLLESGAGALRVTDEPRVADTATLQEVLLPFDSESLLELSLSEHMEEGTPTAADDKSSDSDPPESEGEGDEDSGMCDRCRGPLCKGFVVAAGLENIQETRFTCEWTPKLSPLPP